MRNVRQEIFSSLAAWALPMAVVLIFPYGAVSFKASQAPLQSQAFAAFVTLSDEDEQHAIAAVKAAWQGDAVGLRRIRAELSVGELPEEEPGAIMEVSPLSLEAPQNDIAVQVPVFPPSLRAAPPEKIAPPPATIPIASETFSRTELLKID
jgi:hypothetical protein